MTTIRITVHLRGTLEDAYRTLLRRMEASGLHWTPTYEWYTDQGFELTADRAQRAMDSVEEEERLKVTIIRDDQADSPREYQSEVSTLWIVHPHYSAYGDDGAVDPEECPDKIVAQLPVYALHHSDITLQTARTCQWDSAYIGVLYMTEEHARAYGEHTDYEEVLKGMLRTMNHYISGNVWGYQLGNGDSCWGFFGITFEETGMLDSVPKEYHENMKKAWEDKEW